MTEIPPPARPARAEAPSSQKTAAIIVAILLVTAALVFALTRGGGSDTTQIQPPTSPATVSVSASPSEGIPTPSDSGTSPAPASASPSVVASPSSTVPASPAPAASTVGAGAPASTVAPAAPAKPSNPDDPGLAECTAVSDGFVPERYAIEAVGAKARVLSLGLDNEGNIAAPPKNESDTASWWNQGPRPGSDRGKAVLSIHTYRNGGAVGNDLYAGGTSQLKPGDLIKLYGPGGQVLCYEFAEAKKIWIDDYDPNSDVMVDFEGRHQLAIIICWDFDRRTEIWDSRIFFYGNPITP
ncbi:class F sortase [Tessaracoccus flavus]|uniref:class F sortase n=1 Tax=Tessaracoccus flavus TaxID=1610493 RepID=UPI00089959EE|nr:class F sortase [Tessaracoccus flavus]SDY34859.1 hypothetical protein SAMN05428934_101426 [Tessaracoccus flavus]